jgi:enoyl-CoA hydratase/carnithine racemase
MACVTFAVEGRLGLITPDRPPANAYDLDVMLELERAIDAAIDDDRARAVVIRSASDEFFCAGADVKAFMVDDLDANMEMVLAAHRALAKIAPAAKVFMAWIAGHALSGGLEIAPACDLRDGAQGAYRLGALDALLGLMPGAGGTQRLPRIIGRGPALELLLTARPCGPTRRAAAPTRSRGTTSALGRRWWRRPRCSSTTCSRWRSPSLRA